MFEGTLVELYWEDEVAPPRHIIVTFAQHQSAKPARVPVDRDKTFTSYADRVPVRFVLLGEMEYELETACSHACQHWTISRARLMWDDPFARAARMSEFDELLGSLVPIQLTRTHKPIINGSQPVNILIGRSACLPSNVETDYDGQTPTAGTKRRRDEVGDGSFQLQHEGLSYEDHFKRYVYAPDIDFHGKERVIDAQRSRDLIIEHLLPLLWDHKSAGFDVNADFPMSFCGHLDAPNMVFVQIPSPPPLATSGPKGGIPPNKSGSFVDHHKDDYDPKDGFSDAEELDYGASDSSGGSESCQFIQQAFKTVPHPVRTLDPSDPSKWFGSSDEDQSCNSSVGSWDRVGDD